METLEMKKQRFYENHEKRMKQLDAVAKEVDSIINGHKRNHKECQARLDEINKILDEL